MGLVTGTTQHRLDLVRTYDDPTNPTNPYLVGTNGCTNVTTNNKGEVDTVSYTINGISYVTTLFKNISNIGKPSVDGNLIKVPNLNGEIYSSYVPRTGNGELPLDVVYPTTFQYTTKQLTETDYFVFKDEAKMGIVFEPKVVEEIFIERQRLNSFEIQSRLSEINTLDELEDYNNGFYNIIKL